MDDRLERKAAFIRGLAEYLVGDQAKKSIDLQLGKESAQQWSRLRHLSGLWGYPEVDEAEQELNQLLG